MNRTIATVAAFASLGALAPAPALAGYYVATSSSTQSAYNQGASATYTSQNHDFGYGGPVNPPYATFFASPTGSASGTTDTTGLATSSFDNAASTNSIGPGSNIASTSSDLSTATTHAAGQNTSDEAFSSGQAESRAELGDTLHFAVAGANPLTSTTIGFQYVVRGTYLDLDPTKADTELKAILQIQSASANTSSVAGGVNLDVQANSGNNGVPTVVTANAGFLFGGGTFNIVSQTPDEFVVDGTLTLPGAASSLLISTDLEVANQSGVADLDFTSSFSFTSLPSNVSYTSDSGVFLAPASVPEPASLGLVLLGGGVVGLAAWRNRRGR